MGAVGLGAVGLGAVGLSVAMMRAGVAMALAVGRFVVGVALGVGLVMVTETEGPGVVLPAVDGRADGIEPDWQAPTNASRPVKASHGNTVRVALIGPRRNAGNRVRSRPHPTENPGW